MLVYHAVNAYERSGKRVCLLLEVIEFAVKFLDLGFVLFLDVLDFLLERFVRFLGAFKLVQ